MNYKESHTTTLAKQEKSTSSMCYICRGRFLGTNIHHEMRRNTELRWDEHENIFNDSDATKHLKENLKHKFLWKILCAAIENKRLCKILEASEIT